MCVLYVSFGSKVRPRTFGCVAMRSTVLFIFRYRLLLYSAGSGVNRVQVVLSGFSVRLFCFVHAKRRAQSQPSTLPSKKSNNKLKRHWGN